MNGMNSCLELSILKQQKLEEILSMLGETSGKRCLDIGGDNGVISYFLRKNGGRWASADLEKEAVDSIRSLVKEEVYRIDGKSTPFPDDSFDTVVIVDFLEHIETDALFIKELHRIIKPGGTLIINVPNLRKGSLLQAVRRRAGFTDEKHGHLRPGYTLQMLDSLLAGRFRIVRHTTYVKFFSELIDTAINLIWLKSAKGGSGKKGMIVTEEKLGKKKKILKLYTAVYPLINLISKLDCFLFFTKGASLIVESRKEYIAPALGKKL